MAKLKNINFMSGYQFDTVEDVDQDELYAINIENDLSFRSFVSGMVMPSNDRKTLTVGTSGSTYTAPANGYFHFVGGSSSGNKYARLSTNMIHVTALAMANTSDAGLILPVNKGQNVILSYTTNTGNELKFIYANGEVY